MTPAEQTGTSPRKREEDYCLQEQIVAVLDKVKKDHPDQAEFVNSG